MIAIRFGFCATSLLEAWCIIALHFVLPTTAVHSVLRAEFLIPVLVPSSAWCGFSLQDDAEARMRNERWHFLPQ